MAFFFKYDIYLFLFTHSNSLRGVAYIRKDQCRIFYIRRNGVFSVHVAHRPLCRILQRNANADQRLSFFICYDSLYGRLFLSNQSGHFTRMSDCCTRKNNLTIRNGIFNTCSFKHFIKNGINSTTIYFNRYSTAQIDRLVIIQKDIIRIFLDLFDNLFYRFIIYRNRYRSTLSKKILSLNLRESKQREKQPDLHFPKHTGSNCMIFTPFSSFHDILYNLN